MGPPPPGVGPPPPTPGDEDDPGRIMRFDLSGEIAQPRGELSDRQNQTQAIRLGWLGANFNEYFAMGGSFRFIATDPKVGPAGLGDRTELFIDAVGIYFRVNIPLAPQLKAFIEADPSMVLMHVPCGIDSITCNEDGLELAVRFGLIGRVGGAYEVIPNRLDLVGYGSLEMTFPEEGGWLSFGAGIAVHFGPTRGEIRRRQQWQQQQMYMQQQPQLAPQQGPRRVLPPPQSAPPPPPPPPP